MLKSINKIKNRTSQEFLISVIVALYNGENYLIPQLNTILNQTRQPNEVLLFDDCSTDLTYQLTNIFIKEHGCTDWYLKVNQNNLGWQKNFYELIKAAKGDIIFFSDQDDVWNSKKIEIMCEVMEHNPSIEVLSCNYNMIFEMPNTKWKGLKAAYKNYGQKELEAVKMGKWWLSSLRYGSVLAIKKSIKNIFLEIWQNGMPYDALITAIGIARNSFYILNSILVTHRLHDANNTPHYGHTRKEQIKLLNGIYNMGLAIRNNSHIRSSQAYKQEDMDKILSFLKRRIFAIDRHDIFSFIKLLGSLHLYPRYRTWIADIISTLK